MNWPLTLAELSEWFVYQEDKPLLFTQTYFWGFFAVVLTVFSFIHKHRAARNAFLFLVSLFFYYKTSGFFFFILLFSTVTDFYIGQAIGNSLIPSRRKAWLALSIFLNLGVLAYFKYAYFFTDSFNSIFGTNFIPFNQFAYWSNSFFGTEFRFDKILLPVGISFFTFQTMSYAIDVYRGAIKPVKNVLDFGFYVSFFPQLVAGPIVRAADFIPQLYQPYRLSKRDWGIALFWILNGLLKKVLLADYLANNFMDRIFANPGSYSGFENLMALYGYSLQVYADFSGYTDIAIGVALLMGFRLPINFNSPYKATSVGDFWKRWHISLSTWLKDYLYIPMGGNRGGSLFSWISLFSILLFVCLLSESLLITALCIAIVLMTMLLMKLFTSVNAWVTTNINLMMTMLIGGLWHGASWNFVIWGGLNGLGLVIYKLWKKISPWENKSKWLNRAWAIFLTFNFISFTRIWFRSGSKNTWEEMNTGHNIWEELFSANTMLKKVLFEVDFSLAPAVLSGYAPVFIVMAFGFVIHWLPANWKDWYREKFASLSLTLQLATTFAVLFVVYQILSANMLPFIYFQF